MCPPLCSAGLAALFNFGLLVYSFSFPDWGGFAALFFVVPFGASLTLLFFYWNSRVSWLAGWVLVVSGVVKLALAVWAAVAAGLANDFWGPWAALGVIVFVALATVLGSSALVDVWAGWSYTCRRGGRGTRLREVEVGTV